jgi:hypothetical protein
VPVNECVAQALHQRLGALGMGERKPCKGRAETLSLPGWYWLRLVACLLDRFGDMKRVFLAQVGTG